MKPNVIISSMDLTQFRIFFLNYWSKKDRLNCSWEIWSFLGCCLLSHISCLERELLSDCELWIRITRMRYKCYHTFQSIFPKSHACLIFSSFFQALSSRSYGSQFEAATSSASSSIGEKYLWENVMHFMCIFLAVYYHPTTTHVA